MAGRQWIREALKDFVFSFQQGASAAAKTPGARGGAASLAASLAAPQLRQDMIREQGQQDEERQFKIQQVKQAIATGDLQNVRNLIDTYGKTEGPQMNVPNPTMQQASIPQSLDPLNPMPNAPAPPDMGSRSMAMGSPPPIQLGGQTFQPQYANQVRDQALQQYQRQQDIQRENNIAQNAPELALRTREQQAREEGNALTREGLQAERDRQEANRLADNVARDAKDAQLARQSTAQMEAAATRHREDLQQRELDRGQRIAAAAASAAARTTDKPPTAQNLRTFGFYMRAKDAIDVLSSIEKDVQAMSTGEQYWTALMPNVLQSQLGQTLEQAQRQFTEARLRKDSGAAIPPHEYDNDKKTYFVAPGDTKETLERKRKARGVLVKALENESGRAFSQSFSPAAPPAPGAGAKKDPSQMTVKEILQELAK